MLDPTECDHPEDQRPDGTCTLCGAVFGVAHGVLDVTSPATDDPGK